MQFAAGGAYGHTQAQLSTAATDTEPEGTDHSQEDIDKEEEVDRQRQMPAVHLHRVVEEAGADVAVVLHIGQPEVTCRERLLHLLLEAVGIVGRSFHAGAGTEADREGHHPLFVRPVYARLFQVLEHCVLWLVDSLLLQGSGDGRDIPEGGVALLIGYLPANGFFITKNIGSQRLGDNEAFGKLLRQAFGALPVGGMDIEHPEVIGRNGIDQRLLTDRIVEKRTVVVRMSKRQGIGIADGDRLDIGMFAQAIHYTHQVGTRLVASLLIGNIG